MTTGTDVPALDAAFRWSRESWGVALRCRPLEMLAQHLFTTRQLALRPFDAQGASWRAALAAVGGTPERFVRIKQVHGNMVHVARRDASDPAGGSPITEADAVVSNATGLVVGVQVADCVPLLLADKRSGAVAAVHAGWRGTVAGIAQAAVQTLGREFGVDPADIVAAMGPSIGRCCYEVGPEVMDTFRRAGATEAQIDTWFSAGTSGHSWLDLWRVNQDQLLAAGVPPAQVHLSRLCTKTHLAWFDSYRADGANSGRMAALIRVP
jgi:YfiH family protein